MSAPTPAPGDDRPRDGYYPDPSIPGYVRYWNGASWVPGTSRPAPADGEPLAPPPGARAASGPGAAPVEETGPHFFDEDPADASGPASAGDAQHGSRPEPASAWGADRSRQSGFGGDQDRRVSWGSPQGAPQGAQGQGGDPRLPRPAQPGDGPAQPDGRSARTDGSATIPPAEPDQGDVASGNTFVFRRATAGPAGPAADGSGPGTPGRTAPAAPGVPGPGGPRDDDGTMTFRALSPRTAQQSGAAGAQRGSTGATAAGAEAAGLRPQPAPGADAQRQPASPDAHGAPGFAAGKAAASRASAAQGQAQAQGHGQAGPGGAAAAPAGPQQAPPASGPQQAAPSVPQQPGAPQPQPTASAASGGTPMASGAGGGQPSWAQQVHRLAGASDEEQPVAPWKPPVEDIFQAAARRQASARPAGLGKRLAARLVDTLVLAAVTAGAAVPLGTKAIDHVNEKIDAAKLAGETVTVWLLDGTTSVYLGIILAVLLIFGVLYEALPTAKWGRTLGKKLLGLEVRDIEGGEPPTFGGALRRWLVYSVPGLLGIGLVGVAWGLFDRPWHQCWHDKAAHTFVAG
ncbi:RDD family protein [Streptomyces sp. V4I2]|uniref:RDD family protein n=1 Tax=Streptomyces sp. V4I2 TaxID=3042280 RepID=UPI00278722BD|nr:RDD family protein [Streptomyces sp. V4I2]MDQ1045940.1 putative RDD family membrane protein YckC [Streptomyces sp. V4I2]